MILELYVIQGRPAGKKLVFAVGEFYFGRGIECQIRFNTDWVSRQHCQLRVSEAGATLRDLGSTNGTLINGKLTQGEQALKQGDHVQIGAVTFLVHIPGDAGPPPQPASGTFTPEGGDSGEQRSPTDSTVHHPAPQE